MGCVQLIATLICVITAAAADKLNDIMHNNGMYTNINNNNANPSNGNANNNGNFQNNNGNNFQNNNNLNNFQNNNNLNNFQNNNNLNNVVNGQLGLPNTPSENIDFGPAKSNFSYEVKQPMYGNFYGHQADRDGEREEGRYYVLLPDRRLMTVQYYADETGYHPTITYSSIDGEDMFQNFLFAPEAKGSPNPNSFGSRTPSDITNASPTLSPLLLGLTTPTSVSDTSNNDLLSFPQVTNSNTNGQQSSIITNSNSNGILQFSGSSVQPRVTTARPRLTSQRPILTSQQTRVTTRRTTTRPRTTSRPRTTQRPRPTTVRSTTTTQSLRAPGTFIGFASTIRPITVAPPATPRPRPTTVRSTTTTQSLRAPGTFIGFASTIRPITVAPPATSLSSRSTTPRGGRPFLFPKLDRNNGDRNSAGQSNVNNVISRVITPPSFSYLPPSINKSSTNNANRGNQNGSSQRNNQNNANVQKTGNNGSKLNAFFGTNNVINSNKVKPTSSGTTNNQRNTGQIKFPQNSKNTNAQSNGKNGNQANGNSVSNIFSTINRGYLPPEPRNDVNVISQTGSGSKTSGNELFNNGFSFFEFKKLTTTTSAPPQPILPQSTTIRTTTSSTPSNNFNLAINRLTTQRSTFRFPTTKSSLTTTQFSTTSRSTQPATTRRFTTQTPTRTSVSQTQGRTPSVTTAISSPQRTFAPTTQSPSRTTTEHEYDKDAGPAYIPVPRETSLLADAPLPSGNSGQTGIQLPSRGVVNSGNLGGTNGGQNSNPTTAVPATTLRPSSIPPPRAKQLSPFFEFFKLKT